MSTRNAEGARGRIRLFLEANVGRVVATHEIFEVAAIHDYQRRIRELRDEEGMQILSSKDLHTLKPGEYILVSLDRLPVIDRTISKELRADILQRDGFTCQMCGADAGDPDPYSPGRRLRLYIDHI